MPPMPYGYWRQSWISPLHRGVDTTLKRAEADGIAVPGMHDDTAIAEVKSGRRAPGAGGKRMYAFGMASLALMVPVKALN